MSVSQAIRERVRPVLFMLGFSVVAISLVSALHLATAAAVERNAGLFRQRAVMAAAGLTVPPRPAEVIEWYHNAVTGPDDDQPYFKVSDQAHVIAHVHPMRGQGLWGTIHAMVGVNPDNGLITGVSFVEHNETPGLGARISEPWFEQQFSGKAGPFKVVPEGTRSQAKDEMDAVTGATVTTTAVRDMLNKLMEKH